MFCVVWFERFASKAQAEDYFMYKHLFGPVPSRRLGISLGIDLVPMKTCTLNCVYCECGTTTDLSLERREYIPFEEVRTELSHYLSNNPKPDFITFSGSGEPTLNSRVSEVIGMIKSMAGGISVAVLTNGTLLTSDELRNEIKGADVVMPSLDAASHDAFKKINRPHGLLRVENIIEGLVEFRRVYNGRLWLEVFIVPGVNDTAGELKAIKAAIEKIAPDQVQLNTLDRPGPVQDIRPATRRELENILGFLKMENASIIANPPDRKDLPSFRGDVESAILETIARRPCTLDDLTKILGLHPNEVNKYLGVLQGDKKIDAVKQERGFFYRLIQT